MSITSDHVTGFIVGIGVASLGLYLYKKNEAQVNEWLRSQSINFPFPGPRRKTSPACRSKTCCVKRSGWKT